MKIMMRERERENIEKYTEKVKEKKRLQRKHVLLFLIDEKKI